MKNIKIGIATLALLSATGLAGCHSSGTRETKKKPRESRLAEKTGYKIAQVVRQNLAQTVQLPGEFLAFQEVSLYPKANGFMEKVYVDRGDAVKKGQVLMVLDAPEVEEQLVAARSKYMKAEAVFIGSKDNYRRLLASSRTPGAVSALDLEMAQARIMSDSAAVLGERANYRALEKTKSYMTVRAPFSGVITDRNVHPGALVGPGIKSTEPMLVLQEQSRLRLVVDVPETYSMKVQAGNTVQYTINALPGQVFSGKISRLSGRMNPRFRSEAVEIDVNNRRGQLQAGHVRRDYPVGRRNAGGAGGARVGGRHFH